MHGLDKRLAKGMDSFGWHVSQYGTCRHVLVTEARMALHSGNNFIQEQNVADCHARVL